MAGHSARIVTRKEREIKLINIAHQPIFFHRQHHRQHQNTTTTLTNYLQHWKYNKHMYT